MSIYIPGKTVINVIVLKIISNHGDSKFVGLTEVHLLDDLGKNITVDSIES